MWQNQELHVIKLLGEGSFGTCVQVEDKANGRVHALKQVRVETPIKRFSNFIAMNLLTDHYLIVT